VGREGRGGRGAKQHYLAHPQSKNTGRARVHTRAQIRGEVGARATSMLQTCRKTGVVVPTPTGPMGGGPAEWHEGECPVTHHALAPPRHCTAALPWGVGGGGELTAARCTQATGFAPPAQSRPAQGVRGRQGAAPPPPAPPRCCRRCRQPPRGPPPTRWAGRRGRQAGAGAGAGGRREGRGGRPGCRGWSGRAPGTLRGTCRGRHGRRPTI
jgi:hypothetical protein